MALSRTALLLLIVAPGRVKAQDISAEQVVDAYAALTRTASTRVQCERDSDAGAILVCGNAGARHRLPLAIDSKPLMAARRRPGKVMTAGQVLNKDWSDCVNIGPRLCGGASIDFLAIVPAMVKAVIKASKDD